MLKPLAMTRGVLDIKAPLITSKEKITNPRRVDTRSPKPHRKAVFQMALYFKREFKYDSLQYGYDGNETDELHVAYLWIHPDFINFSDEFRVPCIGATCFRWRKWKDTPPGWAMQWIWLHPYFRRKGLLKASWPKFKEEFPDFICESPLSESMISFLKKMGPSKLEREKGDRLL